MKHNSKLTNLNIRYVHILPKASKFIKKTATKLYYCWDIPLVIILNWIHFLYKYFCITYKGGKGSGKTEVAFIIEKYWSMFDIVIIPVNASFFRCLVYETIAMT